MDFDPKTSKLRNQEDVNEYLAKYDVCLNPSIKVEFVLTVLMSLRPRPMVVYICILRF